MGLMGRNLRKRPNAVKEQVQASGEEDGEEVDDTDEEEEKKVEVPEEIKDEGPVEKPKEVLDLLAKIDRYLLLRQYLCPYAERVGFAEVLLLSMMRRGELQLADLSKDPVTIRFKNILRVQRHMQKLYPSDIYVLE